MTAAPRRLACRGTRHARTWACAVLLAAGPLAALAQEPVPATTAPAPVSSGAITARPVLPLSLDPSPGAPGDGQAGTVPVPVIVPSGATSAAVRVFMDGCVQHEGALTAVVDWALSQGFEPLDAADEGARVLLDGGYGAVLAARTGAEPVLLAVSADGRCTVWAERSPGPLVHQAMLIATSDLSQRGRLQLLVDRTVERAGAWRRHVQWRYRRAGGSEDWSLGAVTTLGEAPTSQVLQLARLPAQSGYAPDGQPR